MKKVLLSLLAVAALVLSCQNYDDEFDALNSKIASLESQITSLADLRTAVTGVQSSISALQSAVAAAQAAAEAAGDAAEAAGDANAEAAAANAESIAALAASVASIAADLVDLQTAIDGALTEADLDALKSELNTTLAALQALIETNSSSIASLVAANTELKAALEDLGVDVNEVLAANASFEGELTITNSSQLAYAKSLGIKVATIKGNVTVLVDETDHTGGGNGEGLTAAQVNEVLSQITYVVGNVKITADEEVDLSKLTSISGDYIVIGHDASDDNLISVGGDVHFDYDGPYTSKIQETNNIYLVAKAKVVGTASVTARQGTTSIDFLSTEASSLQTVSSAVAAQHTSGASITYGTSANSNVITIPGTTTTNATTSVKIGQIPVVSVQGGSNLDIIELHYAADYDADDNTTGSSALAGVDIDATAASSVTILAKTISGNVDINVAPATATAARGLVSMPNLVSAGGYISDAATNSVFSKLETLGSGGLTLSLATSVSLPELVSSTGGITLTEVETFSAPKLVRIGSASATGAGATFSAPELVGALTMSTLTKAGTISVPKVTSFSAPLAKVTSIDIEEATSTVTTSIELLSLSSFASSPVAGTLTDASTLDVLKLHAQDVTFDLTSLPEATSITYKGKANSTGAAVVDASIDRLNPKVTSVTLGGVLRNVLIDTNQPEATTKTATGGSNADTALASVITSGTIVDFKIQNNFDLTTLTLGHTQDAKSATAPVIHIKNNFNLASFSIAVNQISELIVTGNKKLTSFDLSSLNALPANWAVGTYTVKIDISGNETDPTARRASFGGEDLTTGTDVLANWYGVKGTYSSTAAAGEVYGQSSLATLKTFLNVLDYKYHADPVLAGTSRTFATTSYINLEYRRAATSTTTTLVSFGGTSDGNGLSAANFDTYALFQ